MKVLMFGWEFPPHLSGGLGTACYGLTRALANRGTEIIFVLPRLGPDEMALPGRLRLRSASGVVLRTDGMEAFPSYERWHHGGPLLPSGFTGNALETVWKEHLHLVHVDSGLFPYATEETYQRRMERFGQALSSGGLVRPHEEVVPEGVAGRLSERMTGHTETIRLHGGYGKDLMTEVFRYSQAALGMLNEDFDVIHVHDWMTYPAGMVVKQVTGKPLVAHIHALECDRSGVNMNTEVAAIEKAGLEAADVVVAVSHYTKSRVVSLYGINPDKIEVVHNAVTRSESRRAMAAGALHSHSFEKRVLFMGRVTYQKGPEYFVEAARLVLTRLPDTRFIMAGSGDMLARMVYRVAQLRLGNRFHFTGFLRGEDVDRIYAMSDLYVMPSVSEPFGIAPLEAMAYDVPVIISRQSGVSEVVRHALKVNFWDTRDLADKICAVLSYPCLAEELVRNCREELKTIRWENAADRLNAIYARCVGGHTGGGC